MKYLKNVKTVAVTGATGYVAERLIELLMSMHIHVHAIARNEGDLVELKRKFPSITVFPCPIEDEYLLRKACHGCEGIFHLAAIKGVPIAEAHPLKTVQTNIVGTISLLKIAMENKVKFVVATSSDKAEKMSGVYGASKYIMEKLFMEFASFNGENCAYRVIRFGNIFFSTGSVLDTWKKSLKSSAPEQNSELLITDRESTRFFWTRDEAVKHLLESVDVASSAQPVIPNMKSVKIGTLLDLMLEFAGNQGVSACEVGMREGENKHEFLGPLGSSEFAERWSDKDLRAILRENWE